MGSNFHNNKSELDIYLLESIHQIVSISKNKQFKNRAISQAIEITLFLNKNFDTAERQQILLSLKGQPILNHSSPRAIKQTEILLKHLKNLQELSLKPYKSSIKEDILDCISLNNNKTLGLIFVIVLIGLNILIFNLSPFIWTSANDKICQEKGYWYSSSDTSCHAWYLLPRIR